MAWHIYQKRLLNLASALHATSEREAGDLRKLGLKPQIEVIPWGIDVCGGAKDLVGYPLSVINDGIVGLRHGGQASSSSISYPLSSIHYPPSSPASDIRPPTSGLKTALFVGRIYPVKGLSMLVEAWARVRPIGWKMTIVGPDEAGHLSEVEALIREAGLQVDFEFTGALEGDALRQVYDDADLLILPSYTENFGMVVGEALAHGCSVIASQGSPWSGLLEHGCGWWPEVSSDGLADALQEATSLERAELALMGAQGRLWMQRDFSWEQSATMMRNVYESVAGNFEF